MKVQIVPAAGALIEVIAKDGRKLTNADIRSVTVEPFFATASGLGEVCHGVSHAGDEAEEVDRIMVIASGNTGRLAIKTNKKRPEKSAVPMVDRKKKPAAGAAT